MTHKRAIGLFLGLTALWFISIEATARLWFTPGSRINGRIYREQQMARQTRSGAGATRTFLLVGNSLLNSSIVMPELNRLMAPDWQAQRFMIEKTSFLDWYYGLSRLFREGARPSAVVLMLTTRQIILPGVRDEFFAHFLMDQRDLWDVIERTQLHPTIASGFALGRLSQFYGTREDVRKVLLGRLIPNMVSLAALIAPKGQVPLDPLVVEAGVREKLTMLRRLGEQWNVPILIAIPPTPEVLNYVDNGVAGAQQAGMILVMPVRNGEYGPAFFEDDFHMNEAGARDYTPRFAAALQKLLPARKP
jgi:hypothetical protein